MDFETFTAVDWTASTIMIAVFLAIWFLEYAVGCWFDSNIICGLAFFLGWIPAGSVSLFVGCWTFWLANYIAWPFIIVGAILVAIALQLTYFQVLRRLGCID